MGWARGKQLLTIKKPPHYEMLQRVSELEVFFGMA
jgi:hypothetical protein